MKNHNRTNIRIMALAGVSAAALIVAAGAAWSAPAPQTNYSLDLSQLNTTLATVAQQTQYLITAGIPQLNIGNSTATITGSSVTQTFGSSAGFPAQASNNSFSATAISLRATSADGYDYVANLGAIGNTGTNDGIGILHPQLTGNTGSGAPVSVTASITDPAFTNTFNNAVDFTSGSVDTSNNSATATVTVNQISPDYQVRGTVPTGYSSAVQGSSTSSIINGVVTINNSASVAVTSTQTAFDAAALSGSAATISGATIGNTFNPPATGAISVSAPQTVDGNAVQASFTVNSAHNIFLAETGDSATFNGSVLVSNYQGNTELGGTPANAASVTDTTIGVSDLSNIILDADITLAGAADVSNNSVGAKATGNTAGAPDIAGGNPTIGNAIIFQNGLNVAGSGSTATNSITVPQTPADTLQGSATGDLILANGQGNNGTQISALNGNTQIGVAAGDIAATGTATLNGNQINSAATGNSAVGAIQALGGSSFAGTAVYASLQANDATTISSTVTGSDVEAILGGGADSVANGTVTVSSNAINSSATGNTAGDPTVRSIAIDAANFSSTPGLATVGNQTQYKAGVPVQATTGGGISAANVQGNWGTTPISATATDNGIAAVFLDAAINGVTATVNTNSIGAAASGNAGYTSVTLTGSQGALSAGVSNAQYENNPVTATIDGNGGFGSLVMGQASVSKITVNDNSLSASASADTAVNSLSVTGFSTLTLGDAADVVSTTPSVQYDTATSTSTVIGALALNSNQTNDGNVTASISTIAVGLATALVNGNATATPVTVNGNSASSSAIGAQANNTLTLSPGTLSTASGNIDQIASLGNVQYQGGGTGTGVAISSTVDLSGADGAFGAAIDGSVTANSPVTVSGNGVSAFAAGNIGTNTLTVTGTNYAAAVNATPLQSLQSAGVQVLAEFALQNAQFDNSTAAGNAPGSRSATIIGANIGISLTDAGTIGASAQTVSGNSLDTDARNNYASNGLNLTGFSTLSTSAGVQNFQNSTSTVTSTVTDGKIGIDADGYTSLTSPLTVTGNGSQARAIANTAFNSLAVGSETLGGNSGNAGASLSMAGLPDTTTDYVATADYALGNYQNATANTTAGVSGVFFVDLATGALNGSSVTVTGNSMKALAENNNSVNTLTIAAGTTTALGGALMSEQRSTALSTSATAGAGTDGSFGGVQIGGTIGSPISVSGNTLSAIAANNDATNVLNAAATSNLAGQGTTGQAIVGTTGPNVAVTADYSVFNVQNATGGATSATANPGQWGVTVGTTTGISPVTVQNNVVNAQSHINDASNSLTLGGTNVSATGSLGNWQNSSDTSSATINAGSMGFTGGDAITASPLNVSGNSFIASAGGNGATNALNVTATNYTMPINGVASGGTVTGGGYQATAAYAVLNMQQNSGAVTSLATGLNIGINIGSATPPAVSGSPMTVSGNTVMASAYGNNANNSIVLSAGIGTLPSASLTSSQVNSAAITSTVTGVNIGINVGANTGSSAVSSNNNVGAISIGNSAGNTIGIH